MNINIPQIGLAAWSKVPEHPLLFCSGSISPDSPSSINFYRFDPLDKKNPTHLLGKF